MSRSMWAILGATALVAGATALYLVTPTGGPRGASGEVTAHDGPNVLIILWDTTRADKMSLHGFEKATTPSIDRFAQEAVVFERAISPAMWTPPSHASLFTGFAPTHHGVEATNKWLDDHHITLAEWLGEHGYDTYSFSANPFVSKDTNLTQGFDKAENPFAGEWKAAARKATRGKFIPGDASTDISPAWKPQPGQQASGLAHAFKEAAGVAHSALVAWLTGRVEQEKPWFAFINMMEVHIPRVPSLEARKAVMTEDQIQTSLKTDVAQINLLAHTFGKKLYTPDEIAAINGTYEAALIDMDKETGELLADLRARGMLENTIVILTADHGENLGDHGMFGHKYNVYDTLLHVPLMIWFPPKLKPQRVSTVVSNLHLYTTILDLVGLAPPDTAMEANGSILNPTRADPAFSELNETTPISIKRVAATYGLDDASKYMRSFKAVEVDGWKLIRASDNAHELYNLRTDPLESENLFAAEPTRAADLSARIDGWLQAVQIYDPAKRSAKDNKSHKDPADKEMLQQLGYLDGEPEDAELVEPMPNKAMQRANNRLEHGTPRPPEDPPAEPEGEVAP